MQATEKYKIQDFSFRVISVYCTTIQADLMLIISNSSKVPKCSSPPTPVTALSPFGVKGTIYEHPRNATDQNMLLLQDSD